MKKSNIFKKVFLGILSITFGIVLFSIGGQDVYASAVDDLFSNNKITKAIAGEEDISNMAIVDDLSSISFSSVTNNPEYLYVKSENQAYKLLYYTNVQTIGEKLAEQNQTYPVYAPISATLEGKWQISDKGTSYSYYDILKYLPSWEEDGVTYYQSSNNIVYTLKNGGGLGSDYKNDAYYKYILNGTDKYYAYQEIADANLSFKYKDGNVISFDNISPDEYNQITDIISNIKAKEYEYELMIEAPKITKCYEPTGDKIDSEEWNNHPEYASAYYYEGNIYVYVTNDATNGKCYYRYSLKDLQALNYISETEAKNLLDSSKLEENKTILIEENNELIVKVKDNYDLISKTYDIYNCVKTNIPDEVYYQETSYIYNNSTKVYDELTATYYVTSFNQNGDTPTHFDTTYTYWFSYQSLTQYDLYKVLYEKVLYNYHFETANYIVTNTQTCKVEKKGSGIEYKIQDGIILLSNLNNADVDDVLESTLTYFTVDSLNDNKLQTTISDSISQNITTTSFVKNGSKIYGTNPSTTTVSYLNDNGQLGTYSYLNGTKYVITSTINGNTNIYYTNLITTIKTRQIYEYAVSKDESYPHKKEDDYTSDTINAGNGTTLIKYDDVNFYTQFNNLKSWLSENDTQYEFRYEEDWDFDECDHYYSYYHWSCYENGRRHNMSDIWVYYNGTFYEGNDSGSTPFTKLTSSDYVNQNYNGKIIIDSDSNPTYKINATYYLYKNLNFYKYTNYGKGSSGYVYNLNGDNIYDGDKLNNNDYKIGFGNVSSSFCSGHYYQNDDWWWWTKYDGNDYDVYIGKYFTSGTRFVTSDETNRYIYSSSGTDISNNHDYLHDWSVDSDCYYYHECNKTSNKSRNCCSADDGLEYLGQTKYVLNGSSDAHSKSFNYNIDKEPSNSNLKSSINENNIYSCSGSYNNFEISGKKYNGETLYKKTTVNVTCKIKDAKDYALYESNYYPATQKIISPNNIFYSIDNLNNKFSNTLNSSASITINNYNSFKGKLLATVTETSNQTISNYFVTETQFQQNDNTKARTYLTKDAFINALKSIDKTFTGNGIFNGNIDDYKAKLLEALKTNNPYDSFSLKTDSFNTISSNIDYYSPKLIVNDDNKNEIDLPILYTSKNITYYKLNKKSITSSNVANDDELNFVKSDIEITNASEIKLPDGYNQISKSNQISNIVDGNPSPKIDKFSVSNVVLGSEFKKITETTTPKGRFVFDKITSDPDPNSSRYLIITVDKDSNFDIDSTHNGKEIEGYSKYNNSSIYSDTELSSLTADETLKAVDKIKTTDYYQTTDFEAGKYICKSFTLMGSQAKERETTSVTLDFSKIRQNPLAMDADSSTSLYSYTYNDEVKAKVNSSIKKSILNSDLRLEKVEIATDDNGKPVYTPFYSAKKFITSYQLKSTPSTTNYGNRENLAFVGQASASKYGTYSNISFDNSLFITDGDYTLNNSVITTKSRNQFNQADWFNNLNETKVLKYIQNGYYVIENLTNNEITLYSNDDSNKTFGYTLYNPKTNSMADVQTRKITISPEGQEGDTIWIKDIYLNDNSSVLKGDDFKTNKNKYYTPYVEFEFGNFNSRTYGCQNTLEISTTYVSYDKFKDEAYAQKFKDLSPNLYSKITGYSTNDEIKITSNDDNYEALKQIISKYESDKINVHYILYSLMDENNNTYYLNKNDSYVDGYSKTSYNFLSNSNLNSHYYYRIKSYKEGLNYVATEDYSFINFENPEKSKETSYNKMYSTEQEYLNRNCDIEDFASENVLKFNRLIEILNEKDLSYSFNKEKQCFYVYENEPYCKYTLYHDVNKNYDGNNTMAGYTAKLTKDELKKIKKLIEPLKNYEMPLITIEDSIQKAVQANYGKLELKFKDNYPSELVFANGTKYSSNTTSYLLPTGSSLLNISEFDTLNSTYKIVLNENAQKFYVYDEYEMETVKNYLDFTKDYCFKEITNENGYERVKYYLVIDEIYRNILKDLQDGNADYDVNKLLGDPKNDYKTFNFANNYKYINLYVNEYGEIYANDLTNLYYDIDKKTWTSTTPDDETKFIKLNYQNQDNFNNIELTSGFEIEKTVDTYNLYRYQEKINIYIDDYDNTQVLNLGTFYDDSINLNKEFVRIREDAKAPTLYLKETLNLNDNKMGVSFNNPSLNNMVEMNNYIYRNGKLYQLQSMYRDENKYNYISSVNRLKYLTSEFFKNLKEEDIDLNTLYSMFYGTPTIQYYKTNNIPAVLEFFARFFGHENPEDEYYMEPLGALNGQITKVMKCYDDYTFDDIDEDWGNWLGVLLGLTGTAVSVLFDDPETSSSAMKTSTQITQRHLLKEYLTGEDCSYVAPTSSNTYFDYLYNYCIQKDENNQYDAIKLLLLKNANYFVNNSSSKSTDNYIILNVGNEKWVYQGVEIIEIKTIKMNSEFYKSLKNEKIIKANIKRNIYSNTSNLSTTPIGNSNRHPKNEYASEVKDDYFNKNTMLYDFYQYSYKNYYYYKKYESNDTTDKYYEYLKNYMKDITEFKEKDIVAFENYKASNSNYQNIILYGLNDNNGIYELMPKILITNVGTGSNSSSEYNVNFSEFYDITITNTQTQKIVDYFDFKDVISADYTLTKRNCPSFKLPNSVDFNSMFHRLYRSELLYGLNCDTEKMTYSFDYQNTFFRITASGVDANVTNMDLFSSGEQIRFYDYISNSVKWFISESCNIEDGNPTAGMVFYNSMWADSNGYANIASSCNYGERIYITNTEYNQIKQNKNYKTYKIKVKTLNENNLKYNYRDSNVNFDIAKGLSTLGKAPTNVYEKIRINYEISCGLHFAEPLFYITDVDSANASYNFKDILKINSDKSSAEIIKLYINHILNTNPYPHLEPESRYQDCGYGVTQTYQVDVVTEITPNITNVYNKFENSLSGVDQEGKYYLNLDKSFEQIINQGGFAINHYHVMSRFNKEKITEIMYVNNPFKNQDAYSKVTNITLKKFNEEFKNSKTFGGLTDSSQGNDYPMDFKGNVYLPINALPLSKYIKFKDNKAYLRNGYELYNADDELINGDISDYFYENGIKYTCCINYILATTIKVGSDSGDVYSLLPLNYLMNSEIKDYTSLFIDNQYYNLEYNTILDDILSNIGVDGKFKTKTLMKTIPYSNEGLLKEQDSIKDILDITEYIKNLQANTAFDVKSYLIEQIKGKYDFSSGMYYLYDNEKEEQLELYVTANSNTTNIATFQTFAEKYNVIKDILNPNTDNLLTYSIVQEFDSENSNILINESLKLKIKKECLVKLSYDINWKGIDSNGNEISIYHDTEADKEFIEKKVQNECPNSIVVHRPSLYKSTVYVILNDATENSASIVSNQFYNFELRNNNKLNYYSYALKEAEISIPLVSSSKYTLEIYNIFGNLLLTKKINSNNCKVKNPYGTSLIDTNAPAILQHEYISKALRQLIHSDGDIRYGAENNGTIYLLPENYCLQTEKTLGTVSDLVIKFKTNDAVKVTGNMIIKNFYDNSKNPDLEVEIRNGVAIIPISELRKYNWNFDYKFSSYQAVYGNGNYQINNTIINQFVSNQILSKYVIEFDCEDINKIIDAKIYSDVAYKSDYSYLDLNQDGKCDSLIKWSLSDGTEVTASSKYYNILGSEIVTETKYVPNSYLGLYNVPKYSSNINNSINTVSSKIENRNYLEYKGNYVYDFKIIKNSEGTYLYYITENGTTMIIK